MSLQSLKHGFIGLGYNEIRNRPNEPAIGYSLDESSPLFLDFGNKEHTMIVAKSGFGKSYLAGVLGEENIHALLQTALIMFDRMGIFSTMDLPGNDKEINEWNNKLKNGYYHIKAQGLKNIKVWIPLSEQENYESDMYYKTFSIKPSELSLYTFCYTFKMKTTDPQANLFRSSQRILKNKNPDFTLTEWDDFLSYSGESLHCKPQTIEALKQKLEMLNWSIFKKFVFIFNFGVCCM